MAHRIRPNPLALAPRAAGNMTANPTRAAMDNVSDAASSLETAVDAVDGDVGSAILSFTAALDRAEEVLSQREREILGLFADNLTNKEIGDRLFISTGTVKRHAHNIYGKLAVSGRREAVAKATGLGLL